MQLPETTIANQSLLKMAFRSANQVEVFSAGSSSEVFSEVFSMGLEALIFRRLLFVIGWDSALVLAYKRSSPASFEHLLWIQVAVKLDEFPDQPRPARLMAGPQARPIVSMEVLVEQQVIPPMRIGLELLDASVHGAPASLVTQKNALQAGRNLPAHLKEVHQVPCAGRTLD